ncbi:hypothetical protein WJX73_004158 [Symbiochloris irregularis]|uniref:Uncharacterized protein n=1 Tax=Symbiochloris irregularis TaxID=706552 RepID=A0AAW1PMI8_9CHLO
MQREDGSSEHVGVARYAPMPSRPGRRSSLSDVTYADSSRGSGSPRVSASRPTALEGQVRTLKSQLELTQQQLLEARRITPGAARPSFEQPASARRVNELEQQLQLKENEIALQQEIHELQEQLKFAAESRRRLQGLQLGSSESLASPTRDGAALASPASAIDGEMPPSLLKQDIARLQSELLDLQQASQTQDAEIERLRAKVAERDQKLCWLQSAIQDGDLNRLTESLGQGKGLDLEAAGGLQQQLQHNREEVHRVQQELQEAKDRLQASEDTKRMLTTQVMVGHLPEGWNAHMLALQLSKLMPQALAVMEAQQQDLNLIHAHEQSPFFEQHDRFSWLEVNLAAAEDLIYRTLMPFHHLDNALASSCGSHMSAEQPSVLATELLASIQAARARLWALISSGDPSHCAQPSSIPTVQGMHSSPLHTAATGRSIRQRAQEGMLWSCCDWIPKATAEAEPATKH